ncbi:hypothetical protein EDD18DRAFT_1357245 [Armillaria luteobubalina]|uniref:Uncharacterized protein n=1 Tax=Armillaria luteobubalina TaxID=153913 RepID=A0AA39UKA1_9AGAR|nr:hypothetical protein EDD18DRAFT_1357245 [Armillaria luteobubalina]
MPTSPESYLSSLDSTQIAELISALKQHGLIPAALPTTPGPILSAASNHHSHAPSTLSGSEATVSIADMGTSLARQMASHSRNLISPQHLGKPVEDSRQDPQASTDALLSKTGFGYNEEIYLTQNAIHYHILESGEFAALSDLWLETIWQQHVLYWLPNDRSDDGLIAHHKHVQHALRWLYDALDPDTCKEQLAYAAAHEAKVYPPGLPESRHTTVQAPITWHV